MSKHMCPGLNTCFTHPRRFVAAHVNGRWGVYAPATGEEERECATHAEAIQFATSRARAEALAAVQSAEGVTAR